MESGVTKLVMKVEIYNTNGDQSFISELPFMPKKGENISCFFVKKGTSIRQFHTGVIDVVHIDFDINDKFDKVQVVVEFENAED